MTAMLRFEFSDMRTLNHNGHEGSRRKSNHSRWLRARNLRTQDHKSSKLEFPGFCHQIFSAPTVMVFLFHALESGGLVDAASGGQFALGP